ncbi:MAG: hypothetical protein LLG06_19785 [Desulfobacteraceae bacterium]|nr:hypothetical protein [Desulfobacteraceae bacterium]
MQTIRRSLEGFFFNRENFISCRVLAANTAESITVPKSARFVILKGTADFWADLNKTAVIPTGDTDDGTCPILVFGGTVEPREIAGVSAISVISASTPTVTAEFYK